MHGSILWIADLQIIYNIYVLETKILFELPNLLPYYNLNIISLNHLNISLAHIQKSRLHLFTLVAPFTNMV